MRFLSVFSILVLLGACSGDSSDSTEPQSTTPDQISTDTDTSQTDTDTDTGDEVTVGDPTPATPDYPESDLEVVDVEVPECLQPDENGLSEGCAALPEHSLWNCPAGYVPSNSELNVGCIPMDDPCPAGEWATAAGDVLYVQAGANGDGLSAESPLGSITAALNAVTGTTETILVAKGMYNEQVVNDKGVLIKGACASETFLSFSSNTNYEYGVELRGFGQPGIQGVTMMGNSLGLAVLDSNYAVVQDVIIRGKRGHGMVIQNLNADDSIDQVWVELQGVLITRTMASDGQTASSLYAGENTLVDANELLIEGGDALGIDLDGSDITVRNAAIADTEAFALRATDGSSVDLINVVLDANTGSGLEFYDSSLSATDVTVSNTGPSAASYAGDGMFFSASPVAATRVLMSGNHNSGIYAFGIGADASFADLTITMTQPEQANQQWGNGLYVMKGADVAITRGTFSNNHHIGVVAQGNRTMLTLDDSLISHTGAEIASGDYGVGLWATDGAQVELTEVVVLANHTAGVLAAGVDNIGELCETLEYEGDDCMAIQTNVRMRNVIVQDTQPDPSGDNEGELGTGVQGDNGAQMSGRQIVAKGNHFAGVLVRGKGIVGAVEAIGSVEAVEEGIGSISEVERTFASFSDIQILDTHAEVSSGDFGVGLLVTDGGKGEVSKGIIARAHTAGALSELSSVEAVESVLSSVGAIGAIEAVEEGLEADVAELSFRASVSEVELSQVHVIEIQANQAGEQGDGIHVIGFTSELSDIFAAYGYGEIAELSEVSNGWQSKGSVEKSVIEMTMGNSASAYSPMASVEMNDSLAKGRLAVGAVEAVEEGLNSEVENGTDGLAAMHGGSIIATNSVIEQQSRCGILVQDNDNGHVSSVEMVGVQVFNNAIGINIVSDSFDEGELSSVERQGNAEDSASVEVTVDGASAIEMNGAIGMLGAVEMAPAHGAVGAVGAVGAIGAIE